MYQLPNGRVLITGASSGIGAAYARRLAAGGHDLILTARRSDRLAELAAELTAAHAVDVATLSADLATEDGISHVEQTISTADNLVMVINNAGFGVRGFFADVAPTKLEAMIAVHVLAPVRLSRAALPGLIGRGEGAMINVSSISAFFASPGGATYGATKAYLNSFSEALAGELVDTGVVVQSLCPGFTLTEFHDTAEYEDFDRSQLPAPLWMTAEEVVDASLAALGHSKVIFVPGKRNRILVATARSPLRSAVRSVGRRLTHRFRPEAR